MRDFAKKLLFGLFFLTSLTVFSQTTITGVVVDGEYNEPLAGANVVIKGTTDGATTDFDGKFEIKTSQTSGQIIVTYLGFQSKAITFNGTANLGNVSLTADENQLEGVVVVGSGVIDLAQDRKTPIAVSTIKAAEIQAKIGTADVTQALVNTPSVYVAGQAGGYGDSRITVRGFQQDNTAFLLNGQPINGMEDGKMYWSNWSGMSDIANVIQIQRGLGSSKLAISSVGGTVNFVTKATDKKQGGFASMGVANNDYFKSTVGYNTGMSAKGFGFSVMLSHWQGDGYNMGTRGEGQNYFISFGYKPSDKHNFNFLLTGAPQYHDQNYTKSISKYLQYGRKYNSNYGYLNGEYLSLRTNFYHKPVANLNWDFNINETTQLSTVLYASWGRGGGTGDYKARSYTIPYTSSGLIDFDKIYNTNLSAPNGEGSQPDNFLIRSSMNNHAWYGMVTNFKKEINENLSFNAGMDLRTYYGTHYRQVANYMGLRSWTESRVLKGADHLPSSTSVSNTVTDYGIARPWEAMFNTIAEDQRIDYDYSERISYGGVFGQLEYATDQFSAFFQGSISEQYHQRFDRYDYLPEAKDSEKINNLGYNVKGGAAYNINENHSFYANAGFYSRQPYHDNIYLNYTNAVNPLTSNEDVLGFEAGYSFKSSIFWANVNVYRTSWKNRVNTTSTVLSEDTTIGTTDMLVGDLVYTSSQNDEQLHSGAELDLTFKPIQSLSVNGFASIGNWEYKGNANQRKYDQNLNLLDEEKVDVDGGKVGDAAQTTWGLGAKYEIFKNFSIDADWRNYDKLYANVAARKENLELPSYDLVDAGVSYKLVVGKEKKNSVGFRFNMNNVFNEVYLSELTSANKVEAGDQTWNGINVTNSGFFGLGRTWNFSIRYNF
ncbi:carboxypeptidase-like regulatory domain-containing protein [Flavobacterium sp. U410]|jgi:hypothetical protein